MTEWIKATQIEPLQQRKKLKVTIGDQDKIGRAHV